MFRRILKTNQILSLFLLLTTGLISSCSSSSPAVESQSVSKNPTTRERGTPDNYYSELKTVDDFMDLEGEPLSDKFNNVSSVKVVYELKTGIIFYVNSAKFRYHYEFCQKMLNGFTTLESFNLLNYGNSAGREYVLANLNYYSGLSAYALEFVSCDQLSSSNVKMIYNAVSKTSFIKDSLKVLISTGTLVDLDNSKKLPMPRIYVNEIYKNQPYQLLNAGISYGILRKVNDIEKDYIKVGKRDIIIIHGTPMNVPVCSGIITDLYQTPLSHINVLCHNRNILSAVRTDIWKTGKYDKLIGMPVTVTATPDSISFSPCSMDEVNKFCQASKITKIVTLHSNLTVKHIVPVRDFGLLQKDIVGNKAAGLGELSRITKREKDLFYVPEGAFAIPFYFYNKHVSDPTISREINELLSNPVYLQSRDAAKLQLKKIRNAIKKKPLDEALLSEIEQTIKTNSVGNSYRYRSSSNAEDMEGFSAAGLYVSKTGTLGDTGKSIEKAIKNVWASTWDEKAYLERLDAGIDQRTIMMGILCHRNFPDEIANGVVITRHLYRDDVPGITVNVQKGEVSVVSPPDSVACEQFICEFGGDYNMLSKDILTDYISYSSINGNKPLLDKRQIDILYHAIYRVKSYYYYNTPANNRPSYDRYALDIEFKFDKNGKLYLKQCRPYK